MNLYEVWRGHELYWYAVGYEEVAGSWAYGNEPAGSVKCGEFLH